MGLSVSRPRIFAFPMRCHPQADAGDREAVDEESGLQIGNGCDLSWPINSFRIHPYETPIRSPHPSRPTGAPPSPLGKANGRGRLPAHPDSTLKYP